MTTSARAPATKIVFNATGQQYRQTTSFIYLGGTVNETPNLSDEIDRRIRAGWMCFKRYKRELFDRPKASLLPLKARMVRAEVVEAFLYGCATWTPLKGHYAKLRTIHHGMLLRILGAWCKSPNKRIILYAHADSEAYSRDSFRFPRRRPFFFFDHHTPSKAVPSLSRHT